ncbi:MAG: ATP-binding protein [Jaaginema sp. PMC 1079.18]|nr:ATP-binding protein [Jaaginema sp. PMC 1080.18]MEC4853000.1 ATP-binding protein [Jaaginema sp. PMC 1079.18]MEC4865580.1 ATP-binding protein [Jaaginema sp. PMC 1078.18]
MLNSRSFPKLPLQWVLVISFLVQIFGIVGLVGYLSFRSGREAVEDLAEDVIDSNNGTIAEHLNSYLSIPQDLGQINADAIELGILDVGDREAVRKYFWDQMQLYNLTYLGIGLTDGSGIGIARYDGKTVTLDDWNGESENNITTYAMDEQGNPTDVVEVWTWINAEETWYTNPVSAGRPIWSIVTTNIATGPFAVASASRPIYDPQGELLGMLAVDVHLLKLGEFLENLDVSQAGSTFIIERDGTLVGNSGEASPFILKNDVIKRLKASKLDDPLVQAISQKVQEQFGGFAQIAEERDFTITLDGERYFVHIQPWQNDLGLQWLMGTAVAENQFLSEIKANARHTVLLCAIALMIAIAIGILTSRWIAKPILKINQASTAMAKGNLQQTVAPSSIRELDSLTASFNQMASHLQESFVALAESRDNLEVRVVERTAELEATLQELHATQAQIIQSEKMSSLGQLVAGVAHEINNPVNFIHGNLDYTKTYIEDLLGLMRLYEQCYPQPDSQILEKLEDIDWEFVQIDLPKMLSSMQTGTDRIRQIVLSLRNFSRTDEADIKTVDLHEGIDSTLMILQHRLKAKSDRPEIVVDKDYGNIPTVECYPGPLNQVFMNILSNAIDALEDIAPQLGKISIRTRLVRDNWVEIAIADNGPGIPKSIQKRIFEPFFTTKKIGKGTGMGMSISHQIITERHQGHLRCSSHPSGGTEFIIEIPVIGLASAVRHNHHPKTSPSTHIRA